MEIKKLINKLISEEVKKYIKKPLNENDSQNEYEVYVNEDTGVVIELSKIDNKYTVTTSMGEFVKEEFDNLEEAKEYYLSQVSKAVKEEITLETLKGGDKNREKYVKNYLKNSDPNPNNISVGQEVENKRGISGEVVDIDDRNVQVRVNYKNGVVRRPFIRMFDIEDLFPLEEGSDEEISENDVEEESYEDKINRLDDMTEVEGEDEMQENREMCECGGELNEGLCESCGKGINENVLRLTKTEMKTLLNTLIIESSVPGLSVTKKAADQSKKDNESNIKEVSKKLKSQKISDPFKETNELPKPNGGEKKARKNTKEQESEIEEDRGYGMEDIKFDVEPSEEFKKRMRMAILGDPSMGNSQEYVNVVKSDLGKNIIDKSERLKKKDEKKPMYDKDPQPVKIVNEEIEKIKNLYNYNKKTQ